MAPEYKPKDKWYKCPKCDKLVAANESVCKSCGEPISSSELRRQDEVKSKKLKSGDAASGIMAFVFLTLIIAGVLYFIGAFDAPKPKPTPATAPARQDIRTEIDAYITAKDFVREKLVSPKTAKFPGMSEAQIRKVDSSTFIVISYVDSQNVFGAMVRTRYKAKVMYLGKSEWRLLYIQTALN